jgi:hypothetical protein
VRAAAQTLVPAPVAPSATRVRAVHATTAVTPSITMIRKRP